MIFPARSARVAALLLVPLLVPLLLAAQGPVPLYVLNDVRLVDQPDAPRVSLVLREGRIGGILEEPQARVPGARRIDGKGLLALPAFIDAYSQVGLKTPAPEADRDAAPSAESDVLVEMRSANRKGIQPRLRAVDVLAFEKDALEPWRKAGFAVLHVAPQGELLSGRSAVVTAREAPTRDLVLRPSAFHSATFQASGRGYPSTLMGYHAQLRQFLHDVEYHAVLLQRRREGKPGVRPPYDPDLEAALGLARAAEVLVCRAESKADIARWLRLADELALGLVLAGGREAHELVGPLAARRVPVLLTLDWEKEVPDPDAKQKRGAKQEPTPGRPTEPGPDGVAQEAAPEHAPEAAPGGEPQRASQGAPAPGRVRRGPAPTPEIAWEYTEPIEVRRERRRLWEETRRGALRLHEGGVPFAFGTAGGKPGELLKRVRTLVEQGLPRSAAVHALTRGAAELLGIGDRAGRVEVGYDANLVLWTASPMDEKARVAWIVIDGVPHRFEVESSAPEDPPAEGVDAGGTWSLVFESEREVEPTRLVLEMAEDGKVEGSIRFFSPFAAEEVRGEVAGRISGRVLRLDSRLNISGFDVETTLTGEIEGDSLEGQATWRFSQGEQTARFTATRTPQDGIR